MQKEDEITREILTAIGESSDVTQRHLARHLGVALGLANTYLKRCVRKGLVKIRQAPANRYFYYLTPKGFAEKSRLTAQYLSFSFEFYRMASSAYEELIKQCDQQGWNRIILCGASELTEIACIRAYEYSKHIEAIYQPKFNKDEILGRPIIETFNTKLDYDISILTALNDTNALYKDVISQIDKEKVLIPSILRTVMS